MRPVESFRLEPGETKTLTVTFDIPTNVTPGSHYGLVLFTAQNDQGDQDVALSASVGPIVLIEVDGELQSDLQLVEASAARDSDNNPATPSNLGSFFSGGPLSVVLRLQNNGNTFLQPSGTFQVKNFFGKTVKQYEVNSPENTASDRAYVLPDQIRRFENDLDDRLYFGRYTIEGTLSYVGGPGDDFIIVNKSFWVIPYWLIAAIVGVILLVIAIPKLIRRYNQRIINKARQR